MKPSQVLAKPTLFLTDADIRAVFDWGDAIAALREAYASPLTPAGFPPRVMARGNGIWLRTLSGIHPTGGVMGAKLIAANIRSKVASYLIPLFDCETAALSGLMDGNSITGFRTAATSALAVDALANNGKLDVAVIGSGFEAKTHLRALAALRSLGRPLGRVTVFSPNPANRALFVADLADMGLAIEPEQSAEGCAEGANLVLCAARSRDESPTFKGAWLQPGMTVVSIGSTLPEQRELDTEAIARADLIVADMADEVAHDSGDMLAATREGVAFADKLVSLDAVLGGTAAGRTGAEQIMLYKSVGGAVQDITVAAMCLRRAMTIGVGTVLPVSIAPVAK